MILFCADVDHLKIINYTFGHQEAYLVLVEASHILREGFRESDIIARIGGMSLLFFREKRPKQALKYLLYGYRELWNVTIQEETEAMSSR